MAIETLSFGWHGKVAARPVRHGARLRGTDGPFCSTMNRRPSEKGQMSPTTVSAAFDPAQGSRAAISSSSTIRHHERRPSPETLRILGRIGGAVECRMLTGLLPHTGLVPLAIGRVRFVIDAFAATPMLPLGPCLRPRPAVSHRSATRTLNSIVSPLSRLPVPSCHFCLRTTEQGTAVVKKSPESTIGI